MDAILYLLAITAVVTGILVALCLTMLVFKTFAGDSHKQMATKIKIDQDFYFDRHINANKFWGK